MIDLNTSQKFPHLFSVCCLICNVIESLLYDGFILNFLYGFDRNSSEGLKPRKGSIPLTCCSSN